MGALEEEEAEEEVYSRDDMSRYDFALGGNERDQLHGWTAPQHRGKRNIPRRKRATQDKRTNLITTRG